MVNDPIGDMIARIRNAQMRNKSKVSMPGSKQRERVLEVLKTEGFIRGYASVAHASGRSELEIELKYFADHRLAVAFTWRFAICRASTTVLASPFCRLPRA